MFEALVLLSVQPAVFFFLQKNSISKNSGRGLFFRKVNLRRKLDVWERDISEKGSYRQYGPFWFSVKMIFDI